MSKNIFSLLSILSLLMGYSLQCMAQCSLSETTETFNVSGANIQTWTVPSGVTSITLTAIGGDGGSRGNNTLKGGTGATATATFEVTPNEILEIMVGGVGESGNLSGGGGGASGVRRQGATGTDVLIVGGGGGGASTEIDGLRGNNEASGDGLKGNSGSGNGGGNRGTNGNGGELGGGSRSFTGIIVGSGGGGGGLSGQGGNGGHGGDTVGNGGNGGYEVFGGNQSLGFAGANGGYGGGGSGAGHGGGGGGGFSGGGAGRGGGGGGSFIGISGMNGVLTAGNDGVSTRKNGSITICYSPTAIPTVSEWGLLNLALLLMICGTLYLLQPNFREKQF